MGCLVTGGTGFIGRNLVARMDRPVVLGRDPERIRKLIPEAKAAGWSPPDPIAPEVFEGIDTVFHLAGESVFTGRWNPDKKERIMRSRVEGTRTLVESLATLDKPPSTLICSSAIGYYGARGEEILKESSLPGRDFLARVCVAWEGEAMRAEKLGIRVVLVRTGIVLGREGGALSQMLTPFRLGIGGRIGSGRQFMSWIHIEDLVGMMLFAAGNTSVRGPINGVAPKPVTNAVFTRTLAAVLNRPAFCHVPGFVLKMVLGEFADVVLGSQRVLPDRIIRSGYAFKYPGLEGALQNLIGRKNAGKAG